ncbi:fluoride efflux transporter CrcB [Amycolatopsis sp. cg5]|uniref:fluoride efflux transporter CrcB n=1 Tax=Amycolatopsis sp. cg5 TaxID=3238802 RepID=UPI003523AB1D
MNWLLVIAGAVLGAPLRYLTDRAVQARHGGAFPWGTFTVNMIACFVLGGLAGAAGSSAVPQWVQLFLGTGFCATLSTYSTFSYETLRLAETGAKLHAVANVMISVVAGLGGALLGGALVQLVAG